MIELGEWSRPSRFLGCQLDRFDAVAGDFADILRHNPTLRPRGSLEAAPLSTSKGYDASTPVRGYVYDMEKYFVKNVQTYCDVTGTPAKRLGAADTPFLDESRFPRGMQENESSAATAERSMNRSAAQVIMQTMYGARAVGKLATYLTKWGKLQDNAVPHDVLHKWLA